jgi:glucose-1-phosphate cytidylyltransferase
MKVAILAGAKRARLADETRTNSKAMVRIGDDPILWHIMKYYASFGFSEFVVALGDQADAIEAYFETVQPGPVSRDGPRMVIHPRSEPAWTVELIDTGHDTPSGGQIRRLAPYLGSEPFMLASCDGLADVDLDRLLAFHRAHGRLATLTAVHPQARFGRLSLKGDCVTAFQEKVVSPDEWINGGYFVLDPRVLEYIASDQVQWENGTLADLATDGELMVYRHRSFWQCMDTLSETLLLNDLWRKGDAPWKRWALAMLCFGIAFPSAIRPALEFLSLY